MRFLKIAFLPKGRREWLRFCLIWGALIVIAGMGGCVMIPMPGRSHKGPLPPLTIEETRIAANLEKHVYALADEIGERNMWRYEELQQAAEYIKQTFANTGYASTAHSYHVEGKQAENIEARLEGTDPDAQLIVVGGHYDSVVGCAGANDNASGAAATLEVARLLAKEEFQHTICFVAFVNEEPPFFQTDLMGSRAYARHLKEQGETVAAMLALETMGYYTDEEKTQHYPFPLSLFYPGTGNFIGFVGNVSSRKLVRQCVGSFRRHTKFPSEGACLPSALTGVGWSDHWSFWQEGWPAVMLTDTAPFRYPYYHTAHDTPDKIDYERMARAVTGTARIVADLALPSK
jgi:Zn-dependent M28 family amino/carboxypeptidase